MKIYLIRLGGNLYVDGRGYGLFQSTTTDMQKALWFKDYDKALKFSRKTLHSTIEEWDLTLASEKNEEVETLKAALAETRRQNKELSDKLNSLEVKETGE